MTNIKMWHKGKGEYIQVYDIMYMDDEVYFLFYDKEKLGWWYEKSTEILPCSPWNEED